MGQTISLGHLAPYVDVSRQKFIEEIKNEFLEIGKELTENEIKKLAELRVKKEIKNSIQTINYQLNSYTTTNG